MPVDSSGCCAPPRTADQESAGVLPPCRSLRQLVRRPLHQIGTARVSPLTPCRGRSHRDSQTCGSWPASPEACGDAIVARQLLGRPYLGITTSKAALGARGACWLGYRVRSLFIGNSGRPELLHRQFRTSGIERGYMLRKSSLPRITPGALAKHIGVGTIARPVAPS